MGRAAVTILPIEGVEYSLGDLNESLITYDGLTMNQSEWARHLGISRITFQRRLYAGLRAESVFAGPRPKRINKRSLRPRATDDPNRNKLGQWAKGSSPATKTHGHGGVGVNRTRTYMTWAGMLSRCRNPKSKCFKYYGARGIMVDPRWDRFEHFLEDMGEKPDGMSIDRINNDGNYTKANCRWATPKQQANNKRQVSRFYTFAGVTLNQSQWAKRIGIARNAFTSRVEAGWSEQEILQPPIPYTQTRAGLKTEVYHGKLFR